MTHETVVHRADALLATGVPFAVADDVAADGIDEWCALGSLPMMLDVHPVQRELLGPGRTILLDGRGGARWLVDLTGDLLDYRRAAAGTTAAVTVRGALADLLLLIYRRRGPADARVEVEGGSDLLTFWLERVSFG